MDSAVTGTGTKARILARKRKKSAIRRQLTINVVLRPSVRNSANANVKTECKCYSGAGLKD